MNTRDDGGSAFPELESGTLIHDYYDDGKHSLDLQSSSGMSLRDYFAGQALTGLVSHVSGTQEVYRRVIAEDAYRFADAMLKERSK